MQSESNFTFTGHGSILVRGRGTVGGMDSEGKGDIQITLARSLQMVSSA